MQPYDLLPYLHVDRNDQPNRKYESPVGGYVRFWIERVQPRPACSGSAADGTQDLRNEARRYSKEARDPISRLFWGRSHSRVLQAKLVITRSNAVTQSVTLAAASHNSSGREGENWRSELSEKRFLTPYFRVDQGSTAGIEVSLSASTETDSSVTQNILSIIQSGARLAGPTGPLVTALNSDRLNQTSNFVDTAISRLFREKVVESSQSDFPADNWLFPVPAKVDCDHLGSALASIKASFPMGGHVWREGKERDVGEWRVYTTEPIVSIFSTVPLYGGLTQLTYDAARRCLEGPSNTAKPAAANRSRRHGAPAPKPNPPAAPTPKQEELSGPDFQACIAFSGLAPTRVLGLPVAENLTLGQALRGDSGVAAAVQRFQGNGGDEAKKATAREVCNLVAERAEALGLNAYDASAAVWAFAWNGGLSGDLADSIWNSGCLTAQLGAHLRLTGTPSSGAQSPSTKPGPGDGGARVNPPPPAVETQ